MEKTAFKTWAIIELMGHQKIAGLCTEESIAGSNMLRVDVPETECNVPFTRYLGGSAIYAINPCDEATAVAAVRAYRLAPAIPFSLHGAIQKEAQKLLEGNADGGGGDDDLPM